MRIVILMILTVGLNACKSSSATSKVDIADNVVVAHRGAWKEQNLPENSIAALRNSISLGCSGTEFDVRMTADDVLIVTHDKDYHALLIEETSYATLAAFKLLNGEPLPTLRSFIKAGIENNPSTGLVCEIKPSKSKERGAFIATRVLELIDELHAEKYVHSYISFDYDILLKIIEIKPSAKTQYLNGTKTPKELAEDGITGLDYHMNAYKDHPEWIEEAKSIGLTLNVWTVNEKEDLDLFISHEFDYITTNEPELLFDRIKENPTNTGYKMVWNDEFNYNGKPDPKKWDYDYGFIANQEAQYYTNRLENARVENGSLIIEARKEKIKNEKYKSEEFKNKSWMQYAAEIDTAQYTSARILTKGLASWQYGRFEISAKLPEGRGMWPAIWMLGENRNIVSWPECGEIDIMEYVGFEPDTIHGTIHTKAYNHMKGTQKGKTIAIEEPHDSFHKYALNWTPEKIEFLVDGVIYNVVENEHKTSAEWPFDQPFYLILNVAVGGMWGGQQGIDDNSFPQHMEIDYVRVFQLEK